VTRKERGRIGALLKAEYWPWLHVEVQKPCNAVWITVEGPNGDWHANVAHLDSPSLLFLLRDKCEVL
jgi:hypothetical protein